MALLPDGRLPITEKPGRRRIRENGTPSEPIEGVPGAVYRGTPSESVVCSRSRSTPPSSVMVSSTERVAAEERVDVQRRIRDVIQAPDGAILVIVDDAVGDPRRLSPAN